ncbi:MAG: head-tail adaptor protein [Planctomycetes bacterium]|nr:head-tail adaptor protein [Planctomycetota bacterium]
MPFGAGEYTERLTIKQPANVTNAETGEVTQTYTLFKKVWARRVELSARESEQYGQVVGTATHRFDLRWLAGVAQNMRLEWGNRVLDIEQIIERDRQRDMTIIATETTT